MQFNKHAVVLLRVLERWGMSFIHFFLRKNAFPTIFLMLPLSLGTNYDGITVLKQSVNRTITVAEILSYAPPAGLPHFLEAFHSYF